MTTRIRPGPGYDGGQPFLHGTPFYCPWCEGEVWDQDGYDHAFDHQDKAPYADLIIEEYWPLGLAAHAIAEGVSG